MLISGNGDRIAEMPVRMDMQKLPRDKVRNIGVANFDIKNLEILLGGRPPFLQDGSSRQSDMVASIQPLAEGCPVLQG
jgi:hypothetical protein